MVSLNSPSNAFFSPHPIVPRVDLSKTIDVCAFIKEQQKFPVYSIDMPQRRYDFLSVPRVRGSRDFSRDYSELAKLEKPAYLTERPVVSYKEKDKLPLYRGNSQSYSLSA